MNKKIRWFIAPLVAVVIIVVVSAWYHKRVSSTLKVTMVQRGHRKQDTEVVRAVPMPQNVGSIAGNTFTIQVASFHRQAKARSVVKTLKANNYSAYTVVKDLGAKGIWYRVWVGGFANKNDAAAKLKELRKKYSHSFVVERIVPIPSNSGSIRK